MAIALSPTHALLLDLRARIAASEAGHDLAMQVSGAELVIPCVGPNGFDIRVHVGGSADVHVDFGGLGADFEGLAVAVTWIERALSDAWCLRVEYVGDTPIQWELVPVDDRGALSGSLAAGHIALLPSLRK